MTVTQSRMAEIVAEVDESATRRATESAAREKAAFAAAALALGRTPEQHREALAEVEAAYEKARHDAEISAAVSERMRMSDPAYAAEQIRARR